MHIGIKIPNWGELAGPEALVRTAVAADERGFGSVWVSDHLAMPRHPLSEYPYSRSSAPPFDASTPFVEAMLALAHVAAVTTNVQLGTGVLVLPLRHPVLIAKQAASLDVLSRGRLVLGIGVGWLADEFTLLGRSWTNRGRRTDDAIRLMRAAWAGEDVLLDELDGRPTSIAINPLPARGPAVPILIGGHSNAALRRAATLGDGWYASNIAADDFAALVRTLRALPGGSSVTVGARPGVVEATDASEVVAAFAAAGADYVVLDAPFGTMSVAQASEWVHRVADSVDLSAASTPLLAMGQASDG